MMIQIYIVLHVYINIIYIGQNFNWYIYLNIKIIKKIKQIRLLYNSIFLFHLNKKYSLRDYQE